jgi:hypothetical protein
MRLPESTEGPLDPDEATDEQDEFVVVKRLKLAAVFPRQAKRLNRRRETHRRSPPA